MSDNLLSALVSGDSQSPEAVAAIVSQLRSRQGLGELAALSGDKALQPFGAHVLQENQLDQAQLGSQALRNRAEDLQDKQFTNLMAHQGVQEGQAGAVLAESIRQHNLEDKRSRELAQQAIDAGKYDRNSTAQQRLLDMEAQRLNQQTNKLAQGLTQNKMPQVGMAINTLNNTLSKIDNPDQLPGMGYLKNLPGSAFFLSPEGKNFKSQVQGLTNDLLSMYSGLNVTLPEEERRNLEMMTSGKYSSSDFVREWPRIIQRYNAVKNGFLGGFTKETKAQYASNGGFNLDDMTPMDPTSRAASTAAGATPGMGSGGATSTVPGAANAAGLALPGAGQGAAPGTGTIIKTGRRNGKKVGMTADGTVVPLE